jgi:GNAT superfamily N-acetyltransferase
MDLSLRPLEKSDKVWVAALLCERWGSPEIVSRGKVHHTDELPGIIAERQGEPLGLLTYSIKAGECEIVSLDSLVEGKGLGGALLQAVDDKARHLGCKRLWLVTTNDNTHAIDFYRERGFTLSAVHQGAVNQARKLKSEIPTHSSDGIAIEDEWEFERKL